MRAVPVTSLVDVGCTWPVCPASLSRSTTDDMSRHSKLKANSSLVVRDGHPDASPFLRERVP